MEHYGSLEYNIGYYTVRSLSTAAHCRFSNGGGGFYWVRCPHTTAYLKRVAPHLKTKSDLISGLKAFFLWKALRLPWGLALIITGINFHRNLG